MKEVIKSCTQQAFEDGEIKGEIKGVRKVAVNLLKRGRSVAEISEDTGMSIEILNKLKEKLSV